MTSTLVTALKRACSTEQLRHCGSAVWASVRRWWQSLLQHDAWRSFRFQGVLASLLLHGGLMFSLAWSWLDGSRTSRELPLQTEWVGPETPLVEVPLPVGLSPTEIAEPTANGGSSGNLLVDLMAPQANVVNPLESEFASVLNWNDTSNAELRRTVRGATAATSTGFGRGKGQGAGHGVGDGRQFFGLATEGQSFVYVLDCSLSMNHPHDSEFKTRFRRLKQEVVNSVTSLRPDQQFFIVFFNHEAIPMPTDRLVSAAPENLHHFLTWMDQVPARGDTDPTAALQLALRLQPDVLYFLTDGSFSPAANDIVCQIQQSRTVIHTFSFAPWLTDRQKEGLELMRANKMNAARLKLGEATYRRTREVFLAEQVLQTLASQNRGQFHVIP
jgi:hypothetical protein